MKENNFYNTLLEELKKIVKENNLLKDEITVSGKILTAVEAIGSPKRNDYPILKGKEKLVQVDFRGEKGQAYTDMSGEFKGTIEDVLNISLNTNFNRAIFIATLNAVCKYLKITDNTIHCKDEEPEKCSKELAKYIKEKYDNPKIALIGFQPAMLQQLSKEFKLRVVDLDKDKIGTERFGVKVENGNEDIKDLIDWCDIIIATGSTIANNTINNFICKKPALFFGTTIAGAANILGMKRFCPCSK